MSSDIRHECEEADKRADCKLKKTDGVLVCAHTQSCKSVVEMGLGTNHRHPAVCRNIHLMAVYTRAD